LLAAYRLRGRSGGRQIKVNSAGEAVAMMGDVHAVPGNDLQLSIDWRLQAQAETAMAHQIAELFVRQGDVGQALAYLTDPLEPTDPVLCELPQGQQYDDSPPGLAPRRGTHRNAESDPRSRRSGIWAPSRARDSYR